jgi:hypothetical protein
MKKKACALVLLLSALGAGPARAEDALVTFEGGIGVIPVSNVAGTQNANGTFPDVIRNDVRGVAPGGQPWVIERLTVTVKLDGRISVDGRGLLLAGSNSIGTNGGQSVLARLFCGTVAHDSGTVPLDASGDFRIDDVLTPIPPDPCTTPILLIVSSNGRWFAAGIPKP